MHQLVRPVRVALSERPLKVIFLAALLLATCYSFGWSPALNHEAAAPPPGLVIAGSDVLRNGDRSFNEEALGRQPALQESEVEDPAGQLIRADDFALKRHECSEAFPDFYASLDAAVAYRKEHGSIQLEDLADEWKRDGLVRAMIYNQRLYVIRAKHSGSGYDIRRSVSLLSSIHRALVASPELVPDIEFVFSVNDTPEREYEGHVLWTLAKKSEYSNHWLMPDFGFWTWEVDLVGEYSEVRRNMELTETPFHDKIAKTVWRGAAKVNRAVRSTLLEKTKGRPWADAQEVRWSSRRGLSSSTKSNALPLWELCKYKYLLHTEGASYSGRGKYLQNCHSVTIMHERVWKEHYDHLLVDTGPERNYVKVARDWSDLEEKVSWLEENGEVAEAIANNSAATFRDRYLTPAAQACYWRRMFDAWSLVSFRPELYEQDGRGGLIQRGVPFETFL